MNGPEQSNIEEINTDIISLDTEKGIQSLKQLKNENQRQNIKCKYKDFTFDIDLKMSPLMKNKIQEILKQPYQTQKIYNLTNNLVMQVKKTARTQYNY